MLLDEQDKHLLAWNWNVGTHGYYQARVNGVYSVLHRIVAGAGPGQIVDHINGNKLDNRRSNLRLCSSTENRRNRSARRDSLAPYKGITRSGSLWLAQIQADKKYRFLGRFRTAEEAAVAYDAAARELHGEFAKTNFPEDRSRYRDASSEASA